MSTDKFRFHVRKSQQRNTPFDPGAKMKKNFRVSFQKEDMMRYLLQETELMFENRVHSRVGIINLQGSGATPQLFISMPSRGKELLKTPLSTNCMAVDPTPKSKKVLCIIS